MVAEFICRRYARSLWRGCRTCLYFRSFHEKSIALLDKIKSTSVRRPKKCCLHTYDSTENATCKMRIQINCFDNIALLEFFYYYLYRVNIKVKSQHAKYKVRSVHLSRLKHCTADPELIMFTFTVMFVHVVQQAPQ